MAERAARLATEAMLAEAVEHRSADCHLKLERSGSSDGLDMARSERSARLLDQLDLEELEAGTTEDELAAEKTAGKTQTVRLFEYRRPVGSRLYDIE